MAGSRAPRAAGRAPSRSRWRPSSCSPARPRDRSSRATACRPALGSRTTDFKDSNVGPRCRACRRIADLDTRPRARRHARRRALPDYAPVPRSALGPALNEQGYYVGRVERNLYWVTDGTYQSAFLTTSDGVVLLDAPPTIGHNIQRAVDEIAAANGVSNKVTLPHLLAPPRRPRRRVVAVRQERHPHRARGDAAPAAARRRPGAGRRTEETFQDRRTLEIGGERIELAWHGANHSPDNIFIHLPDHDTLMLDRHRQPRLGAGLPVAT